MASLAETGITTPSALRAFLENLGGAAWVNQFSSGSRETDGLAGRPRYVERLLMLVADDVSSAVVGRRTGVADGGETIERREEAVERKDGEE